MTLDPAVYLAFLGTVVCLFWSLPHRYPTARTGLLVLASAFAVLLASPMALLVAVATALLASAASIRLARQPTTAVMILAVGATLSTLAASRLLPLASDPLPLLDLTGAAFFTLKAVAIIADGYRFARATRPLDALLLVLFFPIYEAGPIEAPSRLNRDTCAAPFDLTRFAEGIGRILIGIAKQSYLGGVLLAGLVGRLSPWDGDMLMVDAGPTEILIWALLKWGQLYLVFSGYTDVAIGSSRLFGITIRENFNYPFMARTLQEFWQRWHISLIDFMSAYVYQPLVRRTGWRYRGIFGLFLLSGLWHAATVQYLIWGAMHGTAMAGIAYWQRSEKGRAFKKWAGAAPGRLMAAGLLSRIATLLFVAWASAIGTSKTWAATVAVLSLGGLSWQDF